MSGPAPVDWDDLRYFLSVAEGGGLTPAARGLKVNPSTVGRHVDSLEQHLGVRLFDRQANGYLLTPAGEKLRSRVSRIAEEVYALAQDFDHEDRALAGPVAVMVPDSLTVHFLVANLGRLRERHPGIRIDLIADNRSVNLSRRDADIAVRFGRPEQGELIIRRIGTLGYGLYASEDYLARRGTPSTLEDLQQHDLFNFVDDYSHFGPVDWLRRYRGESPPVFRSNNATERLVAARAGLGMSLAPQILTEGISGLVRVLPDAPMPALDIWLLVHRDLSRLPRVRAVLDFIVERAEAERARLAGT